MENWQELYDLATQAGISAQAPTGDLVCAFVGEWNAGKSSVINALTGVKLPARPTPTTKTLVRLRHVAGEEARATLIDAAGQRSEFAGAEALAILSRSTEGLTEIELTAAGLSIPPGVVFVDTPGFNDDDQVVSTRAETVQADVVIFVFQATGSVINQTQVNFIEQILLLKGNLEDIYFVVTHADLLDNPGQRREIEARFHQKFGAAAADRLFFVANPDGGGIETFKRRLYDELQARQPRLLADRRQRLGKQLAIQLRHELDRRRALLAIQRGQRDEDKRRLEDQMTEARQKEREQRARIRDSYRQRLRDTADQVRDAAEQATARVEQRVGEMTVEQLQAKGALQEEIRRVLDTQFTPVVESRLKELLQSLQADVDVAQRFSADLIRDLSLNLPVYDSPLAKVSAEHILPLAAIGSIAIL
ncbi:MAG: dynamin family protein, partial [Pseudomonadota bacterium]